MRPPRERVFLEGQPRSGVDGRTLALMVWGAEACPAACYVSLGHGRREVIEL